MYFKIFLAQPDMSVWKRVAAFFTMFKYKIVLHLVGSDVMFWRGGQFYTWGSPYVYVLEDNFIL